MPVVNPICRLCPPLGSTFSGSLVIPATLHAPTAKAVIHTAEPWSSKALSLPDWVDHIWETPTQKNSKDVFVTMTSPATSTATVGRVEPRDVPATAVSTATQMVPVVGRTTVTEYTGTIPAGWRIAQTPWLPLPTVGVRLEPIPANEETDVASPAVDDTEVDFIAFSRPTNNYALPYYEPYREDGLIYKGPKHTSVPKNHYRPAKPPVPSTPFLSFPAYKFQVVDGAQPPTDRHKHGFISKERTRSNQPAKRSLLDEASDLSAIYAKYPELILNPAGVNPHPSSESYFKTIHVPVGTEVEMSPEWASMGHLRRTARTSGGEAGDAR